VIAYAGSSDPLHFTVLAYTSKEQSCVTADPGYEAGMHAATLNDAKIVKVPLAADHSHDVKAMVAADPNAGVFYICNPNNPGPARSLARTASITRCFVGFCHARRYERDGSSENPVHSRTVSVRHWRIR